ncbi:MAG: Fic family protein, partial [Gammaproteobacteria bacterium]|nr:Fic family protein [Gammaproteobacteria bacterium]
MKFDPQKPYNDLPALPPKADIETRAILKQCITARSALAELKQAAELIPNQTILINTIPLLEAKDSSEIENIVTTTDELFKYAQGNEKHTDQATKETLWYRTALFEGHQLIKKRPLNTNTAVSVCSIIKGTEMQIRRVPGTALANDKTGKVIYTPPEGEQVVRGKLANWEKFLHDGQDIDPLIRLAVAHYQFEAIHP